MRLGWCNMSSMCRRRAVCRASLHRAGQDAPVTPSARGSKTHAFTCSRTVVCWARRIILVAFVVSQTAQAGPWTPPSGHGYVKVWGSWLAGFEYQDKNGDLRDIGQYHQLNWSAYVEVGLVESLAAWAHAPFMRFFWLEDPRTGDVQSHVAPGDPTLGLRWRFFARGGFALAAEGGVSLPIANDSPLQSVVDAEETGQPVIGQLQAGTRVVDLPLTVTGGYSFGKAYTAASVSYIIRTDGYAHDVGFTAEGGYTFGVPITLRLRTTGRFPLPIGDAPRSNSPSGIGNGTSYLGFAGEFEYAFYQSWSAGFSIEAGPIGVRRQARGPVLSLSLSTHF